MNSYSFNPKTAFVFSGGASLGSIEVGALKAIVEHGVHADMVLGTSVGSLNGAMYASNPSIRGVQLLEEIWQNIKVWNVFTPSPVTPLVNLTTFGQYLVSPKNLRKLIEEKMPFTRIEEAKLPLYIVCTDIKTGKEVVFNKGLLIEALMSSAGIPGVFPPQHFGDKVLLDGGVLNNAPISTAVRLGAQRVVVFPIGLPSDKEPANAMEILIHSMIYLLNRQLATDIQLYKDKTELIIVPPPDHIDVGPHDFSKSELLIKRAYAKAINWLTKEGFKPNADTISFSCDVHTPSVDLMEASIPDEGPKATARIKEASKSLKETLDEKADQVYTGLVTKTDEIKEKVFKKKSDEDS
ncbi:MAG: patatin-like phospholipase family protein [Asgard group archaeon]|nr:patatin-like phospholipase family protein [Asgard group archaeon]